MKIEHSVHVHFDELLLCFLFLFPAEFLLLCGEIELKIFWFLNLIVICNMACMVFFVSIILQSSIALFICDFWLSLYSCHCPLPCLPCRVSLYLETDQIKAYMRLDFVWTKSLWSISVYNFHTRACTRDQYLVSTRNGNVHFFML